MCGNGARCVAQLAFELGVTKRIMTIETLAGQLRAEVLEKKVCLWMTSPKDWILEDTLDVEGLSLAYGFVNTGVPHGVIRTDDLCNVDVQSIGSAVRNHQKFQPNGTNVNFMKVRSESELSVRTYERGVEAETLACGTGVTASALIAAKKGWVSLPVNVQTQSGDVLTVGGVLTESGVERVTLTGPAEHVFEGTIEY